MIRKTIVPIANLVMHIPTFQIGRVTFHDSILNISGEPLASEIGEMMSSKSDNPSYWLHGLREVFGERAIAVVDEESEKDINDFREKAQIDIEHALNVLRFYFVD